MKKSCVAFLSLMCGCILSAAEPVFSCDYTNGGVVKSRFGTPIIAGETQMLDGMPSAICLDGKKNYMLVPDAKSLPLKKGATFFAFVRFDENKDYGMLFFKSGEFLLGLYQKKMLYFNTCAVTSSGKLWDMPLYCPVSRGKWCTVAAVLRPNPSSATWTALLYVDGVKKTSRTFKYEKGYPPETQNDLTIGKGWGGVWFFKGDIGTAQIYDAPMTDSQIRALSGKYSGDK